MDIICVCLRGRPIDNYVSLQILLATREMRRRGNKSRKIKDPKKRFEGEVREVGKRAMLGNFRGDQFTATIEEDGGKTQITYLIEDGILEVAEDYNISVLDREAARASAQSRAASAAWN
jgi:hypothetical protein